METAEGGRSRYVEFGDDRVPYLLGGEALFLRAAADLRPDRWIVVTTDSPPLHRLTARIADLLAPYAPVEQIAVADAEAAKSLDTVAAVCAAAMERGASRASVLVAVGGGTVGNIAGLCAALLFRGIRLVQVPTTLIGMSDVVLSLKQGVNLGGVKNGIGTYYRPELIWADPACLDTLPPREIQGAQAEIIKNALILAPAQIPVLFDLLRSDGRYGAAALRSFIELAIAAKAPVLRTDPRERRSALVLEYGHTVGHALEVLSGGTLSHGFGVAAGMRVAARVAVRLGLLDEEYVGLHDQLLAAAGLPLALPAELDRAATPDALAAQLLRDNKRGYLPLPPGRIPMVLLGAPGTAAATGDLPLTGVDLELAVSAFDATRTAPAAEPAAATAR
jgi:3-dehydroquinate synthetase